MRRRLLPVLLLAACGLGTVLTSPASPRPPAEGEIETIATDLAKRLAQLEPFQAAYTTVSPGGDTADITISVNQNQRFVLLVADFSREDIPDFFALGLIEPRQGKIRGITILVGRPDEGAQMTFDFSRFFGSFDSPSGFFLFMGGLVDSEFGFTEDFDVDNYANMAVSLFLDRQALQAGVMFRSTDGPHSVTGSWLNMEEQLKHANAIREAEEFFEFHFPENRVVRIDKQTGLLLEDDYPDPDWEGPREIVLLQHTPLDAETSLESLLPPYHATMKVFEMPVEQMMADFGHQLLQQMGETLAEVEELDALLEEQADPLRGKLRNGARPRLRQKVAADLNEEKMDGFIRETLWPLYPEAANENPEVSYSEFVQTLIDRHPKKMPEAFSDPEIRRQVQYTWQDYELDLVHLTPKARAPFQKALRVFLPVLLEEYMNEFSLAILTEAKDRAPELDAN